MQTEKILVQSLLRQTEPKDLRKSLKEMMLECLTAEGSCDHTYRSLIVADYIILDDFLKELSNLKKQRV
ncbi:hypothetical protein [Flagellimonas nanhaiensis]|uniref:Uncharacterized protein n=1 Tax=Flagellimonas nanhaiensis TaxID=2292706 RepID=A0A371JKW3_9FLAO|nr:hypothetical protein [Allomuricauda nanhaiensis]RDY57561.1 hypothetical protein DX873_18555 [Allomuricauda nanhaiensis]